MKSRLILAAVMLVTSNTISLSDDTTGQASIDGDRQNSVASQFEIYSQFDCGGLSWG